MLSLSRREQLIFTIAIYSPVLVAFLPWFPAAFFQFRRGPTHIRQPQANAIASYFEFVFNQSSALAVLFFIFVIVLLVIVIGSITRSRSAVDLRCSFYSPTVLLIAWLSVPLAGVYALSITTVPVLTNRNLIILIPATYLLLARAKTKLPIETKLQSGIALTISAIFRLNLMLSLNYYTSPQYPQMKEAVQYIVSNDKQYENSLIIGYRIGWYKYYFRKQGFARKVDLVIPGRDQNINLVLEAIEESNPEYVWFLNALATGPSEAFVQELKDHLNLVEEQTYYRSQVWLFSTE